MCDIKNCNDCKYSYERDIAFDECNPEWVYICEIDNHYIGYPEDAEKETCENWTK